LKKYRKEYEESCDKKGIRLPERIFPHSDLKKAFKGALETAKIINFRIHDLRHTFASYLAMNNIPLTVIKDLMRHKSFDMTLRYAHLSPIQKKDAVNKIADIWEVASKKAAKIKKEPVNKKS
jgi:integrase